jgi:hypothetical protein
MAPCLRLLPETIIVEKDQKRKWGAGGETLAKRMKRLKAKKGKMVSHLAHAKPGSFYTLLP